MNKIQITNTVGNNKHETTGPQLLLLVPLFENIVNKYEIIGR